MHTLNQRTCRQAAEEICSGVVLPCVLGRCWWHRALPMRCRAICTLSFLMSLVPHQVRPTLRDKVAIGLALARHFLTIGVEGIIDNPLGGILLVVIFETQMAEALGDSL